ncbi:MAG: PD-(D/E)XK nuclease family protein [Coriobacteriia bacterium]|nr:PD-(D/E)XK nuclease family protein [Coriobacteriia bacterium]MCL2871284.1 PD-(D/E)XK nuclease family protein [Coriobacteriia bacterium]
MTFYVLSGPAQAGKLAQAIEYFESTAAVKDEVLIICATAAQEGDIGRHYAAADCSQKVMSHSVNTPRIRVQSFSGFASALWGRWGDDRELVGPSIRMKIIEELLDSASKERTTIPKALFSDGGKALLASIAASYNPGDKGEASAKEKNDSHEPRSQEDRTIRSLVSRYHKYLEAEGYVEHQYAITLLAKKISKNNLSLSSSKIIVTGFKDFTAAQMKMICACAGLAEVLVLLDWEKDNPATDYLKNTQSLLLENGAELFEVSPRIVADPRKEMSLNSKDAVSPDNNSSEILRWLQSNFLKESRNQLASPADIARSGAVTLGKAQGTDAEVFLMGNFAAKMHRFYPDKPKALLVPQVQTYLRPLTQELERREIPYELDVKTPFGATGFGAALLALLKVCLNEDVQVSAISFVASSCSGLNPDETLELTTRWRRYRNSNTSILSQLSLSEADSGEAIGLIRSYDMSARIGDWNSLITQLYAIAADSQFFGGSSFDLAQEAAAQKAANSALQELYELRLAEKFALKKKKTQEKHAALDAIAEGGIESAEDTGTDTGAEEDQQPGKRILDYDPRVTAADIYALLRDAAVVQTPSPASTSILIAEPSRVYGRRFHSVIAGGLSAKSSVQKSDPSLDARFIARFSGMNLADVGQQQRLDYSSIISAAEKELYLVAQHESLSGEELRAGELLLAVETCLGKEASDKITQFVTHEDAIIHQSPASEEKKEELGRLLAGESVPQVRIPPHGIEARYDFSYSAQKSVSPTTLEDYAYCSYRWMLARYAQGKEVEYGFDAREQGNFAHKVLKSFYEKLQSSDIGKRIDADNLSSALQLYEQVFHEEQSLLKESLSLTTSEEAELVQMYHQIRRFLIGEVGYAPEFIPTYFEHRFGDTETGPVDLGLGMPLRGTIDRVDVRKDDRAAIVVDYKRKVTVAGLASQATHQQLQGVLYSRAAQEVFNVRPVAHDYRSYVDVTNFSVAYSKEDNPPERPLGLPKIGRSKKQYGLTQHEVDEALDSIMQSATVAAEGLIQGEIKIRENSKPRCSYCPYEACPHHRKSWR